MVAGKEGEGMTTEQMNEDVAKWLGRCYHEIEFIPLGPEEFPYCKHCRRKTFLGIGNILMGIV